jgi:hypothetical protein
MDSRNEARHSSLIETKTFMVNKSTVWTGDTPITDENTAFNLILDEIAAQKQIHLQILIGYTIDKANKEQLLVNDLLFVMPNLRTWASRPAINLPAVKGQATMAESDIMKLEDTILLAKAKEMKQLIEDNPAVIDPVYIPAARKTLFDQHIVDFEAVVQMPETMIDQRAAATAAMLTGVNNGIKLRKDTFLDAVKRKRESDPDFFNGFKQSMKIDNNPTHKRSVQGNIFEETIDGSKAIANVRCFIPALDKVAKSGEKGIFIFKSLPAGEYTIIFTKYGYEPVTKTISINDGERTDLKIKLIPKVFPE